MQVGQIRQGDVLLVPVGNEPPATATETKEVILALGEVTGHAHRLAGTAVLEWTEGKDRYVHVLGNEPGTLAHEEHDPIPAPVVVPGQTYRVVQQQEWDLRGEWRKVLD
jgi:hypothetical protein